jgi:hypothetical protein
VDLSKVQAKPDPSVGQQPQQHDSTPQSPAPRVLPKDAEADIDQTVAREQLKVVTVRVQPNVKDKSCERSEPRLVLVVGRARQDAAGPL